jgi:RNA polymerase sigma-70 factor (ECF subfamily)
VTLAQHGDEEAFSEIAFAISGRLFALAQRILRDYDRAEDATQQAIVSIWQALPDLRDITRFDAWTTRVLVNACYVEARHSRSRTTVDLYALPADPLNDEPDLTVADRDQLERGFRRLPVDQRAVLVMHHYLGFELEEIAAVLGVPGGTVKSRAHAARKAMRAALEADARPATTEGRSA